MRVLFTSTKTGEGLQDLNRLLREHVLESRETRVVLDLDNEDHLKFEHWLRNRTSVIEWHDASRQRHLRIRCALGTWGLLLDRALKAGIRAQ